MVCQLKELLNVYKLNSSLKKLSNPTNNLSLTKQQPSYVRIFAG